MTTAADWLYGKITEEALATLRSRLGQPGPMSGPSDPVTQTLILRYLASAGDDNPLFWDEEYAAKTRWGGIIAPPRFLVQGNERTPRTIVEPMSKRRVSFMGEDVLRGVFAMVSGTRLQFERPVRLGDRIRARSSAHDVVERRSRMAGRSVELINKTVYYNQHDEVTSTVYSSVIRMERGNIRDNRKYLDIPPARYTDEEMASIHAHYEQEQAQRRGDRPRYWEDTNPGDELLTLIKGPLTITDIASYFMGNGSAYYTNRMKHLELKANPSARLVNPETNIEDDWASAHWDEYFARMSGIPRPYDEGPMRYDALAHLVTDWMGDDATLRELYVSLRAPNLVGDVSWCTGQVTGKRVENGRHLVDADLWITNQRNEKTTIGTARVELPSRA